MCGGPVSGAAFFNNTGYRFLCAQNNRRFYVKTGQTPCFYTTFTAKRFIKAKYWAFRVNTFQKNILTFEAKIP